MRRISIGVVLVVVALVTVLFSNTSASEGAVSFKAKLTGFEETPIPKLSPGSGTFSAKIEGSQLTYTLTYAGLTSDAFMAHIHFGQRAVTGGIFIWLCGSAQAPGPAGTPTCPPKGGTVSRTVTGTAVVSPANQNVTAGSFADAVAILRSGDAYANVHTTNFPGGEIRGQLHPSEED